MTAKKYKNFIIYWIPVIIYCILIFIQSSYPSCSGIPDLPHMDKLLHYIGYAILGALFFRAFMSMELAENIKLVFMLSIISSTLYGISDEIHQYYISYRNADIMDVLADMTGSVFGVYAYYKFFVTASYSVRHR